MSQGAQKRAGSSASGGAADWRGLETELREAGRLLAAGAAPAAAAREDASGGDAAPPLGRGGRVTRRQPPAGLTQLGLESTPVCGSTTCTRPRALLGPLGHDNIIDGIARPYPCLLYTSPS